MCCFVHGRFGPRSVLDLRCLQVNLYPVGAQASVDERIIEMCGVIIMISLGRGQERGWRVGTEGGGGHSSI